MKTKHSYKFLITLCTGLLFNSLSMLGMAGTLGLSQQALELREGTNPNVVILVDDSGSMDFDVVTEDADNNFIFSGLQPNGDNTGVGTFNDIYNESKVYLGGTEYTCDNVVDGFIYGWHFKNSTHSDGSDLDNLCATAMFNMWRFRNKDFNSLYYDPDRTYTPWPGLDEAGNVFTNIDTALMPENPYPTSKETVSIDHRYQKWTEETGSEWTVSVSTEPDGFVYYTWEDTNGDDLFDDSEKTKYSLNSSSATAEERQNFANWFGYYRSRELLTKAVLANALEGVTNVNLAYATLNNNNSVNLKLAEMNPSPTTGNKQALFEKLFTTHSDDSTPMLTALDEVGKYYECKSDNIFGVSGSDCPLTTSTADSCRQNFAIVITDGVYNDTISGIGNEDSAGSNDTKYDGGAFADSKSNTLADVAMYYYERDLNTNATDNVPVTTIDVNRSAHEAGDTMHQHMTTYIIGFGVEGTFSSEPSDYDDKSTWADDWTDPTLDELHKIDDLRHAAYNGRGMYLSAKNPDELEDSLDTIFESIQLGVASSSSVALNTQSLEQGSKVFRAFYNVGNNTGDLVALEISVDGVISTTEEWSAAQQLDNVIAAGTRNVISYKRTNPTTAEGIDFDTADMTATQLSNLESPLPSSMPALPAAYGGIIADERVNYLRGDMTYEGSNFNDGELRDRLDNEGRLGDFVHSSPVFVGSPHGSGRNSEPYPIATSELYSAFYSDKKNRNQMIYIGGNDGMLHGFNAETGKEVFAYVPGQMYENLADLTSPNYSHQMFVDLTPSIEDVYMRTTAAATGQDWATVLVGGYRAGGKGYFAMNVTDPGKLDLDASAADPAAEAAAQVMWEFTDADDADLGYSYSESFVGMTNAESGSTSSADTGELDGGGLPVLTTIDNKQWGVIFGNGYNSSSTDGDAALFILKVDGGLDGSWNNDYVKISTGVGKAESADGTTPNGISGIRSVDLDGNGTVDYVYAGDYQGNFYRFDLSDSDVNNWNVTLLFSAQTATTTVKVKGVTTTTPGTDYPITVRPFVVAHPDHTDANPELIVVFATGSWITSADVSTTKIESIYGIRDDFSSTVIAKADLVEQEYTLETNTINGFKIRELSSNTINWNNKNGWFIDLDDAASGERALQLQTRGGIGFATTVTPKSASSCGADIESYILAFDPATGGVPENVVFDLNGDGIFDDNDNNGSDVVAGIGLGQASSPTKIVGNLMIIPLSDGSLETMGVQVGSTSLEGKLSWQELDVPAGAY